MKFTRKKICILVSNDLRNDPRVQRQIEVLVKKYQVVVLAYSQNEKIFSVEKKKNLTIYRPSIQEIFEKSKKKKRFNNPTNSLLQSFLLVYEFFYRIVGKIIWLAKGGFYFYLQERFFPNFSLKKSLASWFFNKQVLAENKENNPETKEVFDFSKANFFTKLRNLVHNNVYYLRFYQNLTNYMAEKGISYNPDIVHANDFDTLLAGYYIKKKTGAKLIYDAHEIWVKMGVPLSKIILTYFQITEFLLFRKIDGFISVNQSILEKLQKMHLIKLKVPTVAVYNTPNYQKISLPPLVQKVNVLYQGRYCYDRGLEELTESVKYWRKDIVLNFRALGDEETLQRIKSIIKKNNLENRIRFLKPVPVTKMSKAARGFDIGIIAYRPVNINNELCTPNKLFEYMMAGLALATSDLPELKRIVKSYNNGCVFQPNPKSIAKAVNRLSMNRIKLRQMQKNSLSAAKVFNWQKEQKKLLNIYELLTSNK